MRKLLLILTMLIPAILSAQYIFPKKKDNCIHIYNLHAPDRAYINMALILKGADYFINKDYSTSAIIATDSKMLSKQFPATYFNVIIKIKSDGIYISGKVLTAVYVPQRSPYAGVNINTNDADIIKYKKGYGYMNEAFRMLDIIANSYIQLFGGEIEYLKK